MALDSFLMDPVIKELMEQDIPDEDLDDTFVETFPDFAPYCWAGPSYSSWARTLGFGADA